MPMQRLRRSLQEPTPADRLMRAISNIDKRLEQLRLAGQPISLSAYRARRILQEALFRCYESGVASPYSTCLKQTARAGAMPKPHRPRRDPVERHEALPGPPRILAAPKDSAGRFEHALRTDLPLHACDRGLHTHGAYGWTGEAARKRSRLKLTAAVLLGIAIIFGVSAALAPLALA